MHLVEPDLEFAPGDPEGTEIEEHQVVVRAARHEFKALGKELFGKRLGVCDDLFLVGDEGGLQRLAEADGFRRDDVEQGTALDPREDRLVDLLRDLFVVGEDQTAARTAQGLVGRRRHDVGVGQGRGMEPRGDQPRDMRHIDHQVRPDAVRDRGEPLEIDDPRIRRRARHDQFRVLLFRELLDLVVVDPVRRRVDPVGDEVVVFAREVDRASVREVSPVGERHSEHRVAVLKQRDVNGGVRLGTAVRLDVREAAAEEFFRPLDREVLDDVDLLAPAVVAVGGITLGVLVRQDGSGGEQDRLGDEVLRRDQLDPVSLTVELRLDGGGDLGIKLVQALQHL